MTTNDEQIGAAIRRINELLAEGRRPGRQRQVQDDARRLLALWDEREQDLTNSKKCDRMDAQ